MTNFGPIGQQVYERTYARPLPGGGTESWRQTVDRVVKGNIDLVGDPWDQWNYELEYDRLFDLIHNFDMIPAGRHLWVSGVEGRQFLFNCHRAGWTDRMSDHFTFVFDELMKGGGIGANYSNSYLQNQVVNHRVDLLISCTTLHKDVVEVNPDGVNAWANIVVQDSREGWVRALRQLIDLHQYHTYEGLVPRPASLWIDVSQVRPRGSAINGFGGTASGPGPLADMLRSVNAILNENVGNRLTSLVAMELDHQISRCVIAGNVRRSARMSTKLWSDSDILDFIASKTDHESHWTTNISVELDEAWFAGGSETDRGRAVSRAVGTFARLNGEPGLYNSYYAGFGERGDVRSPNPCGEIALEEWENCNLGHINIGQIDPVQIDSALQAMTRYLIRATFSDILDARQANIVDQNRRIGVGLFGFQEWVIKRFNVRYSDAHKHEGIATELKRMYDVVRAEAEDYAAELGIPVPIKVTTVAPTGTIAKMPGATEGIHPIYAKHFIRRVRFSADDPVLARVPKSVRVVDDIYSANTKVAEYWCEDQIYQSVPADLHHLIESVDEISLDDLFAVQAMVQYNWADNAVSFTANFPDIDGYTIDELRQTIFYWIKNVKGLTVMPDGSRPQAPYERITEAEYRAGVPNDAETLYSASQDECATGACPVK